MKQSIFNRNKKLYYHARILVKYMLNYHSVSGSGIDEKSQCK